MFCQHCGKENVETSRFCDACGQQLNIQSLTNQPQSEASLHSLGELKRMNILLLIFLTIITIGIYAPVWFLVRKRFINSLGASEKIGTGSPIFVIVIWSIGLLMLLFSGFFEGLAEGLGNPNLLVFSKGLELIDRVLTLVGSIMLIVLSFKVRRIFNEHFNIMNRGT